MPQRPTSKRALVFSLLFALSSAISRAEAPAFEWPDDPAGALARDFFSMIGDSSEESIRAFEKAHRSATVPSSTTIDERIRRTQELRQRFGSARAQGVVRSSPSLLVIAARTAEGKPLEFEFNLDPAEPGRITSIGIALVGPRPSGPPRVLTASARAALVEGVAQAVSQRYVFPDIGRKMAEKLRGDLRSGRYDEISDEYAIAARLTQDLRSVQNDKHLAVRFAPEVEAPAPGSSGTGKTVRHRAPGGEDPERENFAFRRVEWLPGNIGYLKLDQFAGGPEAKATADAAMAFLAHADAIVVDLRDNGGGDPEMVRHLTSYFFPERTHLNSMLDRDGKVVEEFWTGDVPGRKFRRDLPLYVLTSSSSFSGAEEFAYNLKALRRATLIGETTGGGAHPVDFIRVDDRFAVGVPYLRAQNPITHTNWEGVGVEPDVKVPAAQALDEAKRLGAAAILRP